MHTCTRLSCFSESNTFRSYSSRCSCRTVLWEEEWIAKGAFGRPSSRCEGHGISFETLAMNEPDRQQKPEKAIIDKVTVPCGVLATLTCTKGRSIPKAVSSLESGRRWLRNIFSSSTTTFLSLHILHITQYLVTSLCSDRRNVLCHHMQRIMAINQETARDTRSSTASFQKEQHS